MHEQNSGLRVVSGAIGAVLSIAAVAVVVWANGTPDDRPLVGRVPHAVTDSRLDNDVPQARSGCGGPTGLKVTLTDLQRAMPYHVPIPGQDVGDRVGELDQAWQCSGSDAMLVFSSGVTIVTALNRITDPAANWARFVENDSAEASLVTVQGLAAAAIDPKADPAGIALGSVTFVANDVWICVVGNHRLSVTELIEISNSLSLS